MPDVLGLYELRKRLAERTIRSVPVLSHLTAENAHHTVALHAALIAGRISHPLKAAQDSFESCDLGLLIEQLVEHAAAAAGGGHLHPQWNQRHQIDCCFLPGGGGYGVVVSGVQLAIGDSAPKDTLSIGWLLLAATPVTPQY